MRSPSATRRRWPVERTDLLDVGPRARTHSPVPVLHIGSRAGHVARGWGNAVGGRRGAKRISESLVEMVREAVAELILTPITWDTLRADPLEQWSVELRRAVRAQDRPNSP